MKKLKVFLIADTLLTGGAEWFILRLCKNYNEIGVDAKIILLHADKINKGILENFPNVKIEHANVTLLKFLFFLDRVINKIFNKAFLFTCYSSFYLQRKIGVEKPDIIHSHLLSADLIAVSANRKYKTRHIITVHGDYIQFIKNENTRRVLQSKPVLEAVDKIIVITQEQTKILGNEFPFIKGKLVKIYNGYEMPDKISQKEVGNEFVFGMIARGLPEKGWGYAIKAFQALTNQNARLILYGESSYLEELKKLNTDPRIIFSGFTSNPLQAVSEIDVGLFPSYYPSESLPTTIIEYLVSHKPVLTTPVGECAQMIECENELAGAIIPMKDGVPDLEALIQLMSEIMFDKVRYDKMVAVAEKAKYKFEMSKCIESYLRVYKN